MDIGEGHAWPVVLAGTVDQLLLFWHVHRLQIVVFAVASAVSIIFLRVRYRSRTRKSSLSPGLEEKSAWLDNSAQYRSIEGPEVGSQTAPPSSQNFSRTEIKRTKPAAGRVVTGQKPIKQKAEDGKPSNLDTQIQPLIFFSSLTGTTERLSRTVSIELSSLSSKQPSILPAQTLDLSYIDLDDYFISGPKGLSSKPNSQPSPKYFYILLLPSYDIDTIITTFLSHLDETHNDFRIDTAPLSTILGYSVFGTGDKEGWPSEAQGFCAQAIEVDRWMAKLTGRKRAYPLGLGDVKSDVEEILRDWIEGLCASMRDILTSGSLGEGVPGSGDAVESGDEDDDVDFPEPKGRKRQKTSQVTDLEDVGGVKSVSAKNPPLAIDFTTYSSDSNSTTVANQATLKEMVPRTSPTYSALTKQGYTIIGSHSGVKICRWTKSALRGRGSCYKNSFYGIKSHLCMETTPSLSCSNKCVFCWRHGTNPVSTTWRWQVDDPVMIFEGAKEGHYKKIKMMRGVPGVRSERFEEAMRIRHCALSLVGEPIFYPRINEFLGLLHGEKISSFLVCNAQHPAELRALERVTQLYVSIDASNRESLRKIDRPLHRDFWERFQECLSILREKRFVQRTVFRLTLVKGFNVENEVEGYADLVEKGLPCFVEVKGVTYCGTSSSAGAGLTMQNVPFYEEVVEFVEALDKALARRGLEYGIAAEHAHSCCILLASKRFLIEGKWNTLIAYERFFKLLEGGEKFGPEDYCALTPEWALWGNGGFDPSDQRVDRKGRPKESAQPVVRERAAPPNELDF